MVTPKTGSGVRGSRSGRPVMVLLDLLGRRWALRILWELRDGPRSFRSLREDCDAVSPSVLNARLGEMRESGLVELREGEGYALTPPATELGELLLPLDAWAKRWARRQNI
jgi:DNA-binding HxlR family transcriptional regulator